MKQLKKTLLTLVALLAVTTGAWATEFTSLKVGDVLHVGDVINTSTNYSFCGRTLGANFQPATLVRANTSSWDITESETGAYYLLKDQNGTYYGYILGPMGFEGGYWPVTDTSDGISVTAITPDGYTELTFAVHEGTASTVDIDWNAETKTGSFKMPSGNVTLEPEYYPQAALTAAPTAINDVPATTDGAIVKAGTVANIGTTETAQGTVMYYVSPTALDDAALLALAADQWKADVPTAEKLAKGEAYVYYYVRGNDSDTDAENFSDGDILAANALQVTLGAAPLWNAEFDLTDAPEADKAGKWSTNIPEGGVMKGTEVTVTYSGTKKVIGVKAEKKAAAPASTPLDNTTTAWSAGTFTVPAGGLTYSDAITVSGDVTLTLTDGETLTLNKGISLASGATLTIQGNGTMNVNGTNGNTSSTVGGNHGTLILTSGTLNAKGGNGGNIGNDTWDAHGGNGGVAINGSVTVSGGTLTAIGGNGGNIGNDSWNSHGGDGGDAISGTLTINGGSTSVNVGSNGSIGNDSLGSTAGKGGKAVAGTVTDNR